MNDVGKLAKDKALQLGYHRHIQGRWRGAGRMKTATGETVFYSGKDSQHWEGEKNREGLY